MWCDDAITHFYEQHEEAGQLFGIRFQMTAKRVWYVRYWIETNGIQQVDEMVAKMTDGFVTFPLPCASQSEARDEILRLIRANFHKRLVGNSPS